MIAPGQRSPDGRGFVVATDEKKIAARASNPGGADAADDAV
jgi:hypothetical protein